MGMVALALELPGYLSFGRVHVMVYGIFAAIGLVLALMLSQRTALLAGVRQERLWDAGVFGVIAAFITSRALLVAAAPPAFFRDPVSIMTLPSLTYSGLLITVLLVGGWLWWKHIPVLDALDAWAPCAALVWALLSVGHFEEGTDAGMPSNLPWAVVTSGDTRLGRVHPVQLYTMAAAMLLCLVLMRRLAHRRRAGDVAALGLLAGGCASFVLDMLRQPVESFGQAWLDPSQWAAAAAMLAGAVLMAALTPAAKTAVIRTRTDMAAFLDDFVAVRGRMDTSVMKHTVFHDTLLVDVQDRFFSLPREFPPEDKDLAWCNEEGLRLLTWYAIQLRGPGKPAKEEG